MTRLARFRYWAEYGAAQALLTSIGLLPLLLVEALAESLARFLFLCLPRRRRIAMDNIRQAGICSGAREVRAMALAAFRTFVTMVVETIVVRKRMTDQNWHQFVRLRISAETEALLHDPTQGLIVASAHLGNWEVVARAASMIKPLNAIYRPLKNPYLERALREGRSGGRLRLISRFKADPMRFVQALARGEILAIMIDQHSRDGGVQVDFFGRKAWTTKSVAMLHLITRAPVLVAFALRTGPLKYQVDTVGPFTYQRSGDKEKDAFHITQSLTAEIEKIARRYPEQYMWGHRRWKK